MENLCKMGLTTLWISTFAGFGILARGYPQSCWKVVRRVFHIVFHSFIHNIVSVGVGQGLVCGLRWAKCIACRAEWPAEAASCAPHKVFAWRNGKAYRAIPKALHALHNRSVDNFVNNLTLPCRGRNAPCCRADRTIFPPVLPLRHRLSMVSDRRVSFFPAW